MNFIYTVFGWPLGWIMYVCYLIVKNYGLALILFTIITKALQLPLAIKQQKSMMKTAILSRRWMRCSANIKTTGKSLMKR